MSIKWKKFEPEKQPRQDMNIVVYSPQDQYGEEILMTDRWYFCKIRQRFVTYNVLIDRITHYCPVSEFPFPKGVGCFG